MADLLNYHIYWVFLIAIGCEAILLWQTGRKYSWRESAASFWINIGQLIIGRIIVKAVNLALLTWVWNYRCFNISMNNIGGFLLLFIGLEFCYYWHHRASHRVRWIWATHAVHHSIKYFNLSAAYRLGWTGWLSGNILFYLPLCWLGFPPLLVTISLSLNLIYQFWIHTELISELGVLDLLLNTPSNHRVHHASNAQYIDKNYGGMTMIFDRLFGTYQSEQPEISLVYGLTKPINSYNPIVIAFYEWARLWQDLKKARNVGQVLRCIFYAPDWNELSK
jgi:sterol desaturase/sphingolipid hydroxylase (fatty acid hydroxylase superfamily)